MSPELEQELRRLLGTHTAVFHVELASIRVARHPHLYGKETPGHSPSFHEDVAINYTLEAIKNYPVFADSTKGTFRGHRSEIRVYWSSGDASTNNSVLLGDFGDVTADDDTESLDSIVERGPVQGLRL